MSVVDMHTHAFPDHLAQRAIEALEADCPWQSVGDGTTGGLIDSMDAAGVDVSVVCMIATKPHQTPTIFDWCRTILSERIKPFPSVHPQTPDAPQWIERFAAVGFAGIKLHPLYQQFSVDDPQMDPIYRAAADCGILIAFHSGCDIAFPLDDDRASPQRLRRVKDRFPTLRMLCTHMGGWRSWDDVQQCLIGTDIYIETSFSLDILAPDMAVEMIRSHGVERVFFGSDWPWRSQAYEAGLVRQLDLGEPEAHAILSGNATDLLGLDRSVSQR